MEKTIAERLGEFCESLSYDEIPEPVVAKAKELILDTIGICIGSSTIDFGMAALRLIEGWGGRPESSLIGTSSKVPAQNAAFANGVLGHGQDYDDTHTDSCGSPECVSCSRGSRSGREKGMRSQRDPDCLCGRDGGDDSDRHAGS